MGPRQRRCAAGNETATGDDLTLMPWTEMLDELEAGTEVRLSFISSREAARELRDSCAGARADPFADPHAPRVRPQLPSPRAVPPPAQPAPEPDPCSRPQTPRVRVVCRSVDDYQGRRVRESALGGADVARGARPVRQSDLEDRGPPGSQEAHVRTILDMSIVSRLMRAWCATQLARLELQHHPQNRQPRLAQLSPGPVPHPEQGPSSLAPLGAYR